LRHGQARLSFDYAPFEQSLADRGNAVDVSFPPRCHGGSVRPPLIAFETTFVWIVDY
jgi:hypothetical protein